MAILPLPALPLPANFFLAQTVLLLVAAALVIGTALVTIVVGQVVAFGWRRARDYWRGIL